MAKTEHLLRVEINPANPIPEICSVIANVLIYHKGQEIAVLKGTVEEIQKHLELLEKGDGQGG